MNIVRGDTFKFVLGRVTFYTYSMVDLMVAMKAAARADSTVARKAG